MDNIRGTQDSHGSSERVTGYPYLIAGVGVGKRTEVVFHSLVPETGEAIVEILRDFSSSYPWSLERV